MNQIVIQAIKERHMLELRYHGWSRIVEPHAYGRDKSGDEVLRCYQVRARAVAEGQRVPFAS